ncbi:MAG: ASKHA domain-containing protein, partial [Armatimonadota bacterium]|nr:ASKHA domain-containing protein [Armatimonadota bacterium]
GLNRAIIAVINDLVARASHEAGVSPQAIYEIAIVGNTCMSHLLLGVSPAGLGTVPFVPSFRSSQTVRAASLGIDVNPEGSIYVAPNIGSFVGADTVGVILAGELDRGDGLRIAVDIGTNGEIVVAKGGELYACSTAAGPAFEGAKISCGMRASVGAIDAVRIDDEVDCHVIGDVRPRGLCGSGLVDAIAELVRVGAVAETGRMLTREEASALPEKVRERLVENEDGMEFVLARAGEAYADEPLTLTARDVRETQLAKAAIYGGMELMLHQVGASPGDVAQLLLAGAFGNYIRRESALAIGLIPSVAAERIVSIGNAAGVGARLMLCSLSERRRAQEIARSTQHVELSEREGFYDRFADAMMLRPLPAER